MANDRRVHVTLECTQCKRRNYITEKNRHNNRDRLEMKKYCRWCSGHTAHKETRSELAPARGAPSRSTSGWVQLHWFCLFPILFRRFLLVGHDERSTRSFSVGHNGWVWSYTLD